MVCNHCNMEDDTILTIFCTIPDQVFSAKDIFTLIGLLLKNILFTTSLVET